LLIENLALRQQLAVFKRQHSRPRLTPSDKIFWTFLRRFWSSWKTVLIVVTPETVVRWHRLLSSYIEYYHQDRTHCGLGKQTPESRTHSAGRGRVAAWPRVGGLHHRYERAA
jgi:hypothetical protein